MAEDYTIYWDNIEEIRFQFSRHSAQIYSGVHVHLNRSLAEDIELSEFDTLFLNSETEEDNRELGPDPVTSIRDKIALQVINQLEESPFDNDPVHIQALFRRTALKTKHKDEFSSLRTKNHLNRAVKKAAEEGLDRLDIWVTIDNWKFDMKHWSVNDFSRVAIADGETSPAEDDERQQGQQNTTNENSNSQSEAIANSITELINAMRDTTEAQRLAAQQPNQSQQTNTPTGTTTPQQTNNIPLPSDVADREKLPTDPSKVPSLNEFGNYTVSFQDPSGQTITADQRYYLHPQGIGPRYTTRTGHTMYFLPEQERKSTWRKEFMAQFPRLTGGTKLQVREWYRAVTRYGFGNNVYIHPYFLFKKNAISKRGFTVGDDTPSEFFDIPKRYESMLHTWSGLIFDCLSKDKTIPDSCPDLQQRVKRSPGGLGYEALYQLIATTHPVNMKHPSDLVAAYPVQDSNDSFQSYFYKFVDFLHLRAFISNRDTAIDDPAEVSTLIQNCKYCDEMRQKTDEERESPIVDKRRKYQAAALLTTLSIYYAEIEETMNATRLRKHDRRRQQRPQEEIAYRQRPSNRNRRGKPGTRTKLGSNSSDSRTTTPSTITPNTTLAVNLIDQVGEVPKAPNESKDTLTVHSLYIHALQAMARDPSKFDTSQPCIVCHQTGHSFEGCDLLNDVEYLKNHRIMTAQHLRQFQKAHKKHFPNHSEKIFRVHSHGDDHSHSDTSYQASSSTDGSDSDFQ